MSHSRAFLRFLEQIDTIFESYKDDSAIYGQKDILKQKSQDKMKSFYQELSFYCFIARNGSKEIKESIRQLLYLTSMSNLSDLEIALR